MLAYTRRGEGDRCILMLHGFLGSGRNLASLARRLSDADPRLSIILPDLTGHGSSPPLPDGADLDALARDVVAFADALPELGNAPLEIVGHSLGGRTALAARARFGGRVGRLILLDIAPGPVVEGRSELRPVVEALLAAPATAPDRGALADALRRTGLGTSYVEWLMTNAVRDPETGAFGWRFDRARLAALQQSTSAADLWPIAEAAAADVSLVRAGRSVFVTDADQARLERAGARVLTVPDAGHFLHVDQPERVQEAIRALL